MMPETGRKEDKNALQSELFLIEVTIYLLIRKLYEKLRNKNHLQRIDQWLGQYNTNHRRIALPTKIAYSNSLII